MQAAREVSDDDEEEARAICAGFRPVLSALKLEYTELIASLDLDEASPDRSGASRFPFERGLSAAYAVGPDSEVPRPSATQSGQPPSTR